MCELPDYVPYATGSEAASPAEWALLISGSLIGPLSLKVASCIIRHRRRSSDAQGAAPSSTSVGSMSTPLTAAQVSAENRSPEDEPIARFNVERPKENFASTSEDLPRGGDEAEPEELEQGERRWSDEAVEARTEPAGQVESEQGVVEASAAPSAPAPRVVYYDLFRTLCVCLVCVTHCSESYVDNDVLATQQWVLPVITIISGSLYAKSKGSDLNYSARLWFFFSFGVALNGIACVAKGIRWWGDSFFLVVLFQMPFVLLFVGGAWVCGPLKRQLKPDVPRKIAMHNFCFYAVLLLIWLAIQIVLWSFDMHGPDQAMRLVCECLLTGTIASVGYFFLPASHKGLLGWILLAWIYGTRMVHKENRPGLEFHFVDIYIWSFVVALVPLSGQASLGWAMVRTWPIWVVGVKLLLVPGLTQRVDQYPFPNIFMRIFRLYLPEIMLVLAFVCIPSQGTEGVVVFPEIVARQMEWLNWWSLVAYMSHWAIYILCMPCIGIVIVFGSMPVFYCAFGKKKKPASSSTRQPSLSEPGTEEA